MRYDGMTVSGAGSEGYNSDIKPREKKDTTPNSVMVGQPSPEPEKAKPDKPTPDVAEKTTEKEDGTPKPMTRAQKQLKEVQKMKKAAEEAMKEFDMKNRKETLEAVEKEIQANKESMDDKIKESTKHFGLN